MCVGGGEGVTYFSSQVHEPVHGVALQVPTTSAEVHGVFDDVRVRRNAQFDGVHLVRVEKKASRNPRRRQETPKKERGKK